MSLISTALWDLDTAAGVPHVPPTQAQPLPPSNVSMVSKYDLSAFQQDLRLWRKGNIDENVFPKAIAYML